MGKPLIHCTVGESSRFLPPQINIMQQNSNNLFFSKKQVRGFLYAFLAFSALEIARLLIIKISTWYSALIPSLFGAVIFFIAFLSLNDVKYKQYARGALLGWIVYVVFAVGIGIVFR